MESHGDAVFGGEIPLSQAFIAANYSLRTQLRAFARTEPPGGIVTPAAAAATGAAGSRLVELCLSLLEDNAHSGDVLYPGEYGAPRRVAPRDRVLQGESRRERARFCASTRWMGAGTRRVPRPRAARAISDHARIETRTRTLRRGAMRTRALATMRARRLQAGRARRSPFVESQG